MRSRLDELARSPGGRFSRGVVVARISQRAKAGGGGGGADGRPAGVCGHCKMLVLCCAWGQGQPLERRYLGLADRYVPGTCACHACPGVLGMTGRLKRTGSGARNLASTGFTVGGLLKNAYTMTLLLFQPLKDAWARRCATPTRCWRRAPCAVDRLRYTRRKSLSLAECPDASHSPGPDTRSQRSLEPSIAQRPPPGRAPPPSTVYHGLAHAVSRNSYFRCVLSYRCIRQALHP